MAAIGDQFPDIDIFTFDESGPQKLNTKEALQDRKVVIFAVPGAFTPTCHNTHLPGFVEHADAFFAREIDDIICVSVNDAFVMKAWAQSSNALAHITYWADGNGDLARALDLSLDGTGFGLGIRFERFSMIVDNGKITHLNIEGTPGTAEKSGATALLAQL